MQITIFDGYVDEPSVLGVPPYISPYVRRIAGVCRELGIEYEYMTIDDWRAGRRPAGDLLVFIGGALVPGKYLRTYPASRREIVQVVSEFRGTKIGGAGIKYLNLPENLFDYVAYGDDDALLYDLLTGEYDGPRKRTLDEWNRWLIMGTKIVKKHPDFPEPLVVEIETFRGCPRYFTGGCSFCIEPLHGKPVFREIEDIVKEVKTLSECGVKNFRIGGQTCIFSYKASGIGVREVVRPNPGAIKELFEKLNKVPHRVLHVDNANPAVISAYPEESRKIAEYLVRYTTSGNVIAFGMESADEQVIRKNNLNATPEDVMRAIEIINEIGAWRGENGLPRLLPGLNFICGLNGETRETYSKNIKFLKDVIRRGLLLRRINIRQVLPLRGRFRFKYRHECWKFRNYVRKEIEPQILKTMIPMGSILRDVFLEMSRGNYTFGRQPGSYPLVIVLPYRTHTRRYTDVKITGYGERSLTAVEYPINLNKAPFSVLKSVPGIGEKRAAEIVKNRPFASIEDAKNIIGDAIDYFTL